VESREEIQESSAEPIADELGSVCVGEVMLVLWGNPSEAAYSFQAQHFADVDYVFRPTVGDNLPMCEPGDVVLGLGGAALKTMQTAGMLPKGRAITSTRGKPVEWNGTTFLLTYDPNSIWNDWTYETWIHADFKLVARYLATGRWEPKLGNYQYAHNLDRELANIAKGAQHVTVDLETLGLDPFAKDAFIVSIQVTTVPGQTTVIRFASPGDPKQPGKRTPTRTIQIVNKTLHRQIQWLLTNPGLRVNGANLKFDQIWMYEHWGIYNSNQSFDTTIVGSILNENRSNSLNTHAKVYTMLGGYDDNLNAKHNKGRMDLIPDDELLPYAAGDTDACHRVMLAMREELMQDKLAARHYMRLALPATRCFEKMERAGVRIDREYYKNLESELAAEQKRIVTQGLALLPGLVSVKHAKNLTLTRAAVIKDYMFSPQGLGLTPLMVTEKTGEPSTAMEHLRMFAEHPKAAPFVKALQEFKDVEKTLGTYVRGFMKHVRDDGLLHPSAMMFKGSFEGTSGGDGGTNTGRLSFRDPAMQTLPKHTKWAKALRKGYVAPPGYVCVNLDFSQGELRIAACLADEQAMIQSYRDGVDLHAKTGGGLNGYDIPSMNALKDSDPDIYTQLRQGGKAGNFGLLYGMGAEGFVTYAESTYGVELELEQAQHQRSEFFRLYPGLKTWHTRQKKTARLYRCVYSPLGRVRHLPLIAASNRATQSKSERQSINSPVQSTLSDMALLAMVEFDKRYSHHKPTWPEECQCVMMTHDALTWYVKEDQLDLWLGRIRECMENLPLNDFGWKPQLSFPVDAEVGPNLADMHEV
jgi:DNA polymerase I-like protein with 3'-5' exonuclease and polymerase domains